MNPPKLHVELGGHRITAVVDTGSTGLVVAASAIPDLARLPVLGPGRLTYSSSGRVMEGHWVQTSITVAGLGGVHIRTEPMPVLAVTRIACLATARNCSPDEHPSRVAMLGIGYAREADYQSQSTPDRNPFLRTEAEASGRSRRGYILARNGVIVGLSQAATDRTFTLVRLERDMRFADWHAPPACFSINARLPPDCGTLLVDTGISGSFLTARDSQLADVVSGTDVKDGTRIEAQIGDGPGPHLVHSFKVGDPDDLVAPPKVIVARRHGSAFLNTGVRFLNKFDVLYDAEQGIAGYRLRHSVAAKFAATAAPSSKNIEAGNTARN